MRSLAHVEEILKLDAIKNADRIELATILGWQCVVKKGEFKVGDFAVYIEVDSIVPDIPYFKFMESRKFRVKTIRLRGQVSEGLLISLKDLKNINKDLNVLDPSFEEGKDLTKLLNIKKYESPSDRESNWTPTQKKKHNWFIRYMTRYQWFRKMFHIKSKSFPSWISKTDEERIQNCPWELKDNTCDWYISEKLDGQSATYWYKHKLFPEFGICSRTVRKSELDGSNWSKVAKQFNIKEQLKKLSYDVVIQGEIIGPKIQGGKYHNNSERSSIVEFPLDFYVFNVYIIKEKRYLNYYDLKDFCYDLGLKTVPMLDHNCSIPDTVNEIVEYSNDRSRLADTDREGIVCRKMDQSKSFKVINPEYLLKEK